MGEGFDIFKKEKGKMRKYFLIAVIFIFLGSYAAVWAQGSAEEKKDNSSAPESKECIPLSKMELSSGQAESIEAIRSAIGGEFSSFAAILW